MSQWTLHNPVRVYFGPGERRRIRDWNLPGPLAVVCTRRGRAHALEDEAAWIPAHPDLVWIDEVQPNPTIKNVDQLALRFRGSGVKCIIAFGGGSVIDTAKGMSIGLAGESFSLERYFSGEIHMPLVAPIPILAVPTTAGTGSEVTPTATFWNSKEKRKHSLNHPSLFPHAAVVDPECTLTLPEDVTVSTGMDAINQAFESIWNHSASPATMAWAQRAIQLGMNALPRLVWDLANRSLRQEMCQCSVLAGLAISQTRTALCHSISYPLTARFGVPHGLACSFSMGAVLRFNLFADDGRLTRLAKGLGFESPVQLANAVDDLLDDLRVRERLRTYVPDVASLQHLAHEMISPERSDNNLRPVTLSDVQAILADSWKGLGRP